MEQNRALVTLPVLLFLAGCLHCPPQDSANTMSPLADALTKLSSKVEAVVRYGNPPENATSLDLLTLAAQRDPELLALFDGYEVRVLSQERHASLLVCTKDGKIGLLEDLGCSAMLDRNLWREQTEMPCAFTLSVAMGCESRGQY